MKKVFTVLLFAGLLLGLSGSVYAAEATKTSEIKDSATTTKVVAKKGVLSDEKKALAKEQASGLIQRMAVVLAQQQNLGSRLGTLINDMEKSGIDVTVAKTKFAAALNVWQKATTDLGTLQPQIDKDLESASPKKAFATTKKTIKSISDEIKQVHASILELIKTLKSSSASTTATSSVSNASNTPETTPVNPPANE